MKTFAVLFISCLVAAGSAYAAEETCEEPWNTLQHSFTPGNVLARLAGWGKSLPRNITQELQEVERECVNKIGSATTYGIRRQVAGDEANNIVALYDMNGIIAGIQVRFNKSALFDGWNNTFKYDRVPMFQTERNGSVEYFVLTAYFVEPATICNLSLSRTLNDLANITGTGYTLYFQNGPNPSDLLLAPMRRPAALAQKYSDNNCFPAMGQHTFYSVETTQENNCTDITPVFLLQNRNAEGCLVGFGLSWVGKSKSPLFEQPPPTAVKMIVGKKMVPECLLNLAKQERLTTIHFFFTEKVQGCGGLFGTGIGAKFSEYFRKH